jgi:hypothetical protein
MSLEVLTPARILEHLRVTDAAEATLDNALSHCNALAGDQRVAWANFTVEYSAFSKAKTANWSGSLGKALALMSPTIAQLDMQNDDAKILDYERQLAAWQKIAARTCGLNVPGITPRDDPNAPDAGSKTLEHIAIAGAVIVSGVVLLVGVSYVRRLF